ncbi:MAG: host specificity protein J [Candidatus Nanopelagicaceae bacterium]
MEKLYGENQRWKITGSGGGGKGGGGAPTEEPDTLRSRAEASIVAAICEGEVEGFPSEDPEERGKFIFLNDTPLISKNGTPNFNTKGVSDVEIQFATGTQSQSPLQGFRDVRIEQSIGTKLTRAAGRISVTTTRSDINRIVVRIGVGSLFKVEDEGDIVATSVEFNIRIFDSIGEDPIVNENKTIEGKSRGPFDREYFYGLTGTGPWTVRVRRRTPDAKDLKLNNDLFFKAIIGILDDKLAYPNTALIGAKFSAEAFSSVPRVSVEIKGLKVKVPTGISADGVWSGEFTTEYSNNPAWVFFDLITNERYGTGLFIEPDDVDVFSLFKIAQYCDEQVSNGRGGSEKRFTFNAVINNRAEAYEVINGIAAAFRGMIYFAQGAIMATQDRPGSVVRQFSPSNVIVDVNDQGELTGSPFIYEGTALRARRTVALVSYNDRNDDFKSKVEYVEDPQGIARYGVRETEIRAFGTTSRSQARRVGYWTLLTNMNETETVSFKLTGEGYFLMPGEIIEVVDPNRTAGVAAGRIVEASSTGMVLDRDVTLEDGKSYTMLIRDGSEEFNMSITSPPGVVSAVSVAPALNEIPGEGSSFFIREAAVEGKKYRVMGLTEDSGIVTVLATEYFEAKYDLIDNLSLGSPTLMSVASSQMISMPTVNPSSISFAGL